MAEEDWQMAVLEAIATPSTRISVDVAGLEGSGDVGARVMAAVSRVASGRNYSPFDWELAQLYQQGQLGAVEFFDDAVAIANPFK